MRLSFYKTFIRYISLWFLFTVLVSCNNDLSSQTPSSEETKSPQKTEANIPTKQSSDKKYILTPGVTPSIIPDSTSTESTNASIWIGRDHWASANQIRTMLVDQSGNLWAGGPGGIVRWDLSTGDHSIYVVETKPETSDVVALAQGSNSEIWIGTFGNGISRISDKKQWQTYKTEDGLPSNYIASLISTSDGSLWVDTSPYARDQEASAGGHFGRFDGLQWVPSIGGGFYEIVASPNGDLWSLTRIQFGQKWESTVGVFRGDRWNRVNIPNEPISATAITVAPNGMVWVAAKTGVFRFDGKIWHEITPPWGEKTEANVSSIEVTRDGTAWFGFSVGAGVFGDKCGDRMTNTEEIGVYRYDGQSWTHFSDKNGLLDNKVCDITLDQYGNILFGTFDKGISLFDGNKWASFVVKN